MSYQFPDFRIQIFCKAPQPGQVKTRLIPAIGADAAAKLHQQLATRMINEALRSKLAPVELWCAPETDHAFFEGFGCPRFQQAGEGLGERMAGAIKASLRPGGENDGAGETTWRAASDVVQGVILIGTDCINLDEDYLKLALTHLQVAEAVLGPAEDGGYGLIGLRSHQPTVFEGVTWSTGQVLAQTARHFNRHFTDWRLLPLLWDLDRPADLARYLAAAPDITQTSDQTQLDQTLGSGF
ncbi:MAG: glycosyltransferase [Pseudomonadales bacterium]|nr:glycosyltransferase [Pseudomonadales bacterium]